MFRWVLWTLGFCLALYFVVDVTGLGSDRKPVRHDASRSGLEPEPIERQRELKYIAAPKDPPVAPLEKSNLDELDAHHDALPDVMAVLEDHFERTVSEKATRKSKERASAVSSVFENAALEERGRLAEIQCSDTICKGVIEIESADAESFVIEKTFMTEEFDRQVPDAFSFTSREPLPDGRVLTTFFIHAQELFALVPQANDD